MSREGYVSDYTAEEAERLALPGCRCSVQQLELVGCDCGRSDLDADRRAALAMAGRPVLSYANRATPEQAKADLEAARVAKTGSYTRAMAWDATAGRWAYADTVLLDLGYEVAAYGDTGGHGFAISTCGLYLSTNSHACRVSDVAGAVADLTRRGFVGRRL